MWNEGVRLEAVAIHQDQSRGNFQLIECQVHGFEGGLEDIDAVDLGGVHPGDGPGNGLVPDDIPQHVPIFFPELFGVVQNRIIKINREDHGGGKNGSGKASSTGLVTSRFGYIFLEESVQHPSQIKGKRYTGSG